MLGRIVFFGTYVLSDAYPVNQVLFDGMRAASANVDTCRVDLWRGFLHRALGGSWRRWLGFVGRAVVCYGRLVIRYLMGKDHRIVVVGYPGYLDIILARLLNLFSRRLLVLVSFISLYDTAVMDRQRIAKGSRRARALFALDRLAFRCADWVLVDTHALGDYYAELFGLPRSKFRKSLVGNVFDRFTAADLERETNDGFNVLFFGTYVPLHGAEFIVEAARILRADSVHFTMIGTGQDFAAVRERAADLEHVHFDQAWHSTGELAEKMRAADVCLGIFGATAKAARVIPYKVFAALALGRPVITRDSPAVRELLVDGESALLCPAGDGAELAAAIRRLRTDSQLRARLAAGGRATYLEKGSSRAIGRDFLEQLEGAFG